MVLNFKKKNVEITENGNTTVIPNSNFNGLSKVNITTNVQSTPKGETYSIVNSIEEMNNIENPANGQIAIIKGEGTKLIRTPFKMGITTDALYIDTTKTPDQVVGPIPREVKFDYSFVGPNGYVESDFSDVTTIPAHCLLFIYVEAEEERVAEIHVNTTSQAGGDETVFSVEANKWLTDKIVFDTPVTFEKIYAMTPYTGELAFQEFTEDTYLGLSKLFLYDKEIPNYIAAYQYGTDGWSPILLDNLTDLILSLNEEGDFEYDPQVPYSGYRNAKVSVKINSWNRPEYWPDIQKIYEDIQKANPNNYVSIFLLDDSVTGITFVGSALNSIMYRTSDNPDVFSTTGTYLFKGVGDIDTGLGYKVRWVATIKTKSSTDFTSGVPCYLRKSDGSILGNGLLWAILGDCNNFTDSILFGASSLTTSNSTLVAVKIDAPLYSLGQYTFQFMPNLESIEFTQAPVDPNYALTRLTYNSPRFMWFNGAMFFKSFQDNCFSLNYRLKGFEIPETAIIGASVFANSGYDYPIVLTSAPGANAFQGSFSKSLFFKMTGLTTLSASFNNMRALRYIDCLDGFIPSISLNFSTSWLSREVMVNFGTKLGDNTGNSLVSIIVGAGNLAKLSDEDKAIFTNKNYGLS